MTAKNWISFTAIVLLLSACRTAKLAHQPVKVKPDIPVHVITEQTDPVKSDAEGEFFSAARYNINKVQKLSTATWQGQLQERLDSIANIPLFESTQLGLCVYDLTDDKMLFSLNADQRMRPASNQKLVTAITALDLLGTNYRYYPTILSPGWGWCWDDDETGIRDFNGSGSRWNADTLYYEKYERTLGNILVPMMKKSDNMLAESMFWQLTANRDLKRVKRKDCVAKVDEVVRKTGGTFSDYVIADGSGVSLYNYLSPRLLLMLLRHAYQHKDIYDALYPALPIAGVDGTLSKRMKGTVAEGNVHAKTGTVTGVSTLSGYCRHSSGHILAFSIMNQGIPKAAVGRDYQDDVCVILCGGFHNS